MGHGYDRHRDDKRNEISAPEEWATGRPAIVSSVQRSFVAMGAVRAVRSLAIVNQPSGFDCPGCAWPEPPPGARHRVEFCESGAKAVAEDGTAARIDATFFALGKSIGIGKGSVRLGDFVKADVILVVGQNPGSNHPRMLTTLEEAKRAGAKIVAINPLPEAGLLRFKNPQRLRGLAGHGTEIADLHLPIRLGADQALFQLWNRWLVRRDASSRDASSRDASSRDAVSHATNSRNPSGVDRVFVDEHTTGFAELVDHLDGVDDGALLAATGLGTAEVTAAFELIAGAERLIICWAMGVTQHVNAIDTINEMTNLSLLGGHIGREGAGVCPIRGHSNVQGDRTMGIFDHPTTELLDALEAEFGVPMPRQPGHDTIAAVRAFADRKARILIGLGGNFGRATPDTSSTEPALMAAQLTVQISTKLNRSHLQCGDTAIILPALGRTDVDTGPNGDQFVTVEDSMGLIHRSTGPLDPPSGDLRSEVTIVCDIAAKLLGPTHPVPWAAMRADNDRVRSHIARVVPGFESFNERVRAPGGFELPHPPRDERRFPTPDGRAHFIRTTVAPSPAAAGPLLLQTLRSHDQYNTTIYGHDDRYRGIAGDRRIIMVNPSDITDLGFIDGDRVDVISLLPGLQRRVFDYRIVADPTPVGCAAAYYPEANVLLSLDHHGPDAQTPAAKAIPIRIVAAAACAATAPG